MSKTFWGVIVVVILIFVGIFAFTGNKNSNGGSSTSSSSQPTNHVEGLGQDKVTLVEYGDYQCPYCGQYYSIVKQVEADYNSQITFQFRNFPLTSLHPNAFAGARAAEAAALQGKFWQMHDLLYEQNIENQQNSSDATWIDASDPTTVFNQDAQSLGLNLTQFKTDYASAKVNASIEADMAAGDKLGVDATPTFFLDGKQISVGESVSAFETDIKNAIAKKAGSITTPATTTNGTTQQSTEQSTQSSSSTTTSGKQ